MPKFDYNVLNSVVSYINEKHDVFSKEWRDRENKEYINLKKMRIDHVVVEDEMIISPEFLFHVDDYHIWVSMMSYEIELEYEYGEYDFRTRVKQKDSIVNKLIHYRNKDIPQGKGCIPINKCLNDIFGLRIIFDDLDHNDINFLKDIELIKDAYDLRIVHKVEEGYIATHLYFKNRSNFNFPWELQIWSNKHVSSNEVAHKEHKDKRKYTEWPDVYLNSTNLERREI